jgi:hypothetical protein
LAFAQPVGVRDFRWGRRLGSFVAARLTPAGTAVPARDGHRRGVKVVKLVAWVHGQNGASSVLLSGHSPAGLDPPRLVLVTWAVAYFNDGPISSTVTSTTERFSPFVS